VGTSTGLSLVFTHINVDYAFGRTQCMPAVDACLIEQDGIYPLAS